MGCICAFCVGFGLYSTLFMVPLFLQTLLAQSAYQSGLVIFPGAVASAISTLVIGKLSQENKIDERVFVTLGIVMYCYAMFLHTQFTLDSNPDTLYWPLVIRGLGLGMIFVPLTNLAMRRLPLTLISGASGVLNLMRQLGGSVGIAIAATLLHAVFVGALSPAVRACDRVQPGCQRLGRRGIQPAVSVPEPCKPSTSLGPDALPASA